MPKSLMYYDTHFLKNFFTQKSNKRSMAGTITGETKREGQYILILPRSGLLVQEKIGQVNNEEENEIWAAHKTMHQNPLF